MSQRPFPTGCVADASVGIKQFVQEPHSDVAEELFRCQPAGSIHVPDLFFVECTNIFWKYVRRFNLPTQDAAQKVADLRALHLKVTPAQQLIESAFALAQVYDITAYDACYAALALLLSVPLVTADVKLSRLPAASGVNVVRLEDYSPSGSMPAQP